MFYEPDPNEDLVWNRALEEAAQVAISWGDVSAGGSGQEIIKEGPSKGQKYGQGYYNLAEAIRRLKRD